jgi:hypothetical protein
VEDDSHPMSRSEKRWLKGCFCASLLGVLLGVALETSANRLGLPTGVAISLGVLAGVLFLGSPAAALTVYLRGHAVTLGTWDELDGADRKAVLRAIRRNSAVEPRLRDAALRTSRRLATQSGRNVYWTLYLAQLVGFNVAVQSWPARAWWLALLVVELGAAGYVFWLSRRARSAVDRFSEQGPA